MAKTDTDFLPAERDGNAEVQKQSEQLSATKLLTQLLNVVPEILLVLNDKRQIVFLNQHLLRFIECRNPKDLYGARPGEILQCIHAEEKPGGCGTTEACRQCGAALAILSAQQGKEAEEECRITKEKHGEAINLRVRTTPLELQGRKFTVLSAVDISGEKRRQVLERVLFEEITHTSDGIRSQASELKVASPHEASGIGGAIFELTDSLMGGVNEHRLLTSAERGELHVKPTSFYTEEFLKELVGYFGEQDIAAERTIALADDTKDAYMTSAKPLLKQVLAHMIRNALEACEPGETVTVHTSPRDDRVEFRVHNPNFMRENVRTQVFQRAFTTKGTGRGLGTYTMKLFSEKYLEGEVKFTSTNRVGTVFMATYPRELES